MSSIDPTGNNATIGNMMPGLVSGMDTKSMVEKLLSGTQAKIDKQNQKKQQIEWKQEIYRNIITKLDNFRTQFFTFSGAGNNNLLSSAFYNVLSTTSSSSAVKVISTSTNAANSIKIDKITQLATARKEAATVNAAKALEGSVDLTKMAADKDNGVFKEYSFSLSLDGSKKTITFSGADNTADVVSQINEQLSITWGQTVQAKDLGGGQITFVGSDAGSGVSSHKIVLTGAKDTEGLSVLGFSEGSSNKVNYNALLKEAPFQTALYGDTFEFSINGTTITASGKDTVGDVVNRINNSDAGVRVSYDSITDRFTMESKQTGTVGDIITDGSGTRRADFKIEQTKGNLMSAMFGTASGGEMTVNLNNTIEKKIDAEHTVSGLDTIAADILGGAEKTFQFVVDGGRRVTVTVKPPEDTTQPYGAQELVAEINKQLDGAFGAGNIKFELNGNQMSVSTQNGFQVSFDDVCADGEIAQAMGFTAGQNQNPKPSSTMDALGLSGTINVTTAAGTTAIQLTGTKTLQQVIDEYNAIQDSGGAANGAGTMSFDADTWQLKVSGMAGKDIKVTGNADAMNTFFGTETFEVSKDNAARVTLEEGQNAILEVNGTQIERNSNEFELDGVNIQLMGVSSDAINLTTERDTDKIVDGIKKFVDEYNEIVDELNGYLTEKSNYRSYAPLTDAQKKDMTDKEIERWEEKAKQGLLRNDMNIESLLSNMRSVMYRTEETSGFAMYDIGIETTANYLDNGKLTLDEDKLRAALSTNIEKVQQLFTDQADGVGKELSQILKDAAYVSSGSPGVLVQYAGAKTALDTQNTLSKELKEITDRIKSLNSRYEKERSRYWQQFTEMEKALSQLNTQSSWLNQQSSGSN